MNLKVLAAPKWVGFIVSGLLAAALMIRLGLWQLDRRDERQTRAAAVLAQERKSPVPVETIVGGLTLESAVEEQWRTVTATGIFDATHEVLIANRSFQTKPGYHVVTPLKLTDRLGVLINRGWIPLETRVGERPSPPLPPPGVVTVTGRVRVTQTRGSLGPKDSPSGVLPVLARTDVARISGQTPYPLLPLYVEAETKGTGVEPVPAPESGSGPHLAYAVQWFAFAGAGIVAWVIILRRALRKAAP